MDKKNHTIEKKGVSLHRKNDVTMKPGKRICSQLKEIRRSIAAENEIPYHERECTYEGPCRGTCPYCEAELRHLTQQLQQRILSGKAATVAGIAVSLASLTACGSAGSPEPAAIEVDTVVIKAGDTSALPPDTVATEGLVRRPAAAGENSDEAIIAPPCVTGELVVEDFRKDGGNDCQGVKNETDFEVGEVEGEIEGEPYIPLDIEPEFPGGQESLIAYLQRNIRYPQKAREQHITGKVFVTFVIEKDGRVSHVRILRDIGGGCGQEAVRVVEAMPKWKAGMRQGKSVPAQFNLPVQFSLENEAE